MIMSYLMRIKDYVSVGTLTVNILIFCFLYFHVFKYLTIENMLNMFIHEIVRTKLGIL